METILAVVATLGVSWGMAATALLIRADRERAKDNEDSLLASERAMAREVKLVQERDRLLAVAVAKDNTQAQVFASILDRPEPEPEVPMVYRYDEAGFLIDSFPESEL